MPRSILLVDDHSFLREGIRAIIERTAEFQVVGEAGTGTEAVRMCVRLHPDLVLMDIGLPEINGIDATAQIMCHCPATKVVILSVYDDRDSVVQAFRHGARAFLLKKASAADLLDALRIVSQGGSYLSSEVADCLLSGIRSGHLTNQNHRSPVEGRPPREQQVLGLLAQGKTSKQVAAELGLGLETVRGYRKSLTKKLGVGNIAVLTKVAIEAGLVEWSPSESAI